MKALLLLVLTSLSCRQVLGISPPSSCVDPLMIDDMEDGDAEICRSGGRRGGWFGFGDGTSTTMTPGQTFTTTAITDGTRGTSRRAARMTGSGFSNWGALMGFSFNTDGLSVRPYEAAVPGGLTFWMKSTAPVFVEVPTLDTVLVKDGGACVDGGTSSNCNRHFKFALTDPGDGWKQYRVPFTALRQDGAATWKPTELLGVNFTVGAHVAFDVWVDDVAFYNCATPECVPTCVDPRFPLACPQRGSTPAACIAAVDCAPATASGCADPLLIDDLEDGDKYLCRRSGRPGEWFVVADGTGTDLTPSTDSIFTATRLDDGTRGSSQHAARFSGAGFVGWGALMGLVLNPSGPYDASSFAGITFWMRSRGPIVVELTTPDVLPEELGGSCHDTANGANCHKHYRHPLAASEQWAQYKLPFAAFQQTGSAQLDASKLTAIQFAVETGDAFDVWMDDIAFYVGTTAGCADTALIDDLEDGNGSICNSGGRRGGWWIASDETSRDLTPAAGGPFLPAAIPGARGGSRYAARLAGAGFTGWGAQMSVSLLDRAGYDASGATGISFWVKSSTPAVMVAFATPGTVPVNQGGTCVDDGAVVNCYNDFAFQFTLPDMEHWFEIQVPFAALRQLTLGSATWDPSKLFFIKFNPTGVFQPFETWIDDLRFYF